MEGGLRSEGKSPSKKKVKLDPCGKVEKLDPSLGTCSRDEKRPNAEDHVVEDVGGPPCFDQHEVSIDKSGEVSNYLRLALSDILTLSPP